MPSKGSASRPISIGSSSPSSNNSGVNSPRVNTRYSNSNSKDKSPSNDSPRGPDPNPTLEDDLTPSSASKKTKSISTIEGSDIIKYLEAKKPFTEREIKRGVLPNKEEQLSGSIIKYLVDIKILVCFRCKIILNPREAKVLEHLRVL